LLASALREEQKCRFQRKQQPESRQKATSANRLKRAGSSLHGPFIWRLDARGPAAMRVLIVEDHVKMAGYRLSEDGGA
jgi:hypothetical protein